MKYSVKVAIGVGVAFICGFAWRDVSAGRLPSASLVLGSPPTSQSAERTFRENYNRILTRYEGTVNAEELKYAGIAGLMASLGDPHTIFLEPKAAQQFSDETKANFFGIGASLEPDPLGAKVQTVFEDAPAYAAGLREDDLIVEVNGKKIAGNQLPKIVEQIKGPAGTFVKLSVITTTDGKPKVLSIRRAKITTPTVRSRALPDQIGYLNIMSFSEPTAAQFDRELDRLEKASIKGLVIDLRGNPGGLLNSASDLLSRFVENKPVVSMQLRDGRKLLEKTYSGARHPFDYPVVCLIDETSASAAEIFAGCLRDYGKATLVGEHSYGKASVQNVFPLIDRASAKITIAKYYLPMGQFIGRVVDEDGVYVSGGLQPNIEAPLSLDSEPKFANPASDNQLRAAIDAVKARR